VNQKFFSIIVIAAFVLCGVACFVFGNIFERVHGLKYVYGIECVHTCQYFTFNNDSSHVRLFVELDSFGHEGQVYSRDTNGNMDPNSCGVVVHGGLEYDKNKQYILDRLR